MNTQIIYLNGPSSSGKSTLAKALQESLEEPFLHIGIDKIIGMMPEKINNWVGGPAPLGFSWKESKDLEGHSIQDLQTGSFARKIVDTYHETIGLFARLGHHLIVDDVAFGQKQVDRWRDLLRTFSVLYVGVKSPLEVLELREKQRGDRILGSSRAQYHQVHLGSQYDLEVDTSVLSIKQCVDQILNSLHSQKKRLQ